MVATAENITQYEDQSVYVLEDPNDGGNVKYVGRTNDPVRREKEHHNDPKHPERSRYRMKVVRAGRSVVEAKIFEQLLITSYGLEYLDNARREIAKKNVDKFNKNIPFITHTTIHFFEILSEFIAILLVIQSITVLTFLYKLLSLHHCLYIVTRNKNYQLICGIYNLFYLHLTNDAKKCMMVRARQ